MKEKAKRNLKKLIFPTVTFILALFVSGIVLAVMGYSPLKAYRLIFLGTFKTTSTMGNALANSIPLMLAGLAVSLAGKAGILNLGVEGQLYIGGMLGTVCALFLPVQNRILMLFLVLAVSMLGGMLWGGIVGVLKAKFKTNEVVVALMLNYAAIFIAGIVSVLIWFIFQYTVVGYKLRSIGSNAKASLANGIQCGRYLILSMCLSGAVAGLIGSTEIMGKYYRFTEGFSNDIGFTGVAIAALAGYNPFAVVLVSILFGILNAGSLTLGREMGVSSKMFMVMQGIIVLFVATPYLLELFVAWRRKKERGKS